MQIYDEKSITKNIGLCVYVLRKEKNITAIQLAHELGKTECAITAWERGEKNPSLHSLLHMCNFFNCTLDEFLVSYERVNLYTERGIDIQKRNKTIFDKYKKGFTMRQLSDMYGISAERISVICRREQDNIDRKNDSLWQFICIKHEDRMSIRTYNCLRRGGIHTKESLMEVIDDLISGHLQLTNLGHGCRSYLEQIRNAA